MMRISLRPVSAVLLLLLASFAFADGKTPLDAPTISCATGGSGATVNVIVTGGASGAPAGFSIHWILRSEYEEHGWSGAGSSYCEASFSGNANGRYYSLAPGESVKIPIGQPFTIPGASSRCDGVALKCGETYAFRVFAHGNTEQKRSPWSETTFCSTMSCAGGGDDGGDDEETGCTQTVGYFAITGPSTGEDLWPVDGLTLGNVFYTNVELEAILNTPSTGRGIVELSQQLIAAKLNVASGASGGGIEGRILAADALIGNIDVRTGKLPTGKAAPHITALLAFNQGAVGPGSCE